MDIEKEYNKQLNVMLRETAIEGWSKVGVVIRMMEETGVKDLQKDFQKIKDDLLKLIHKMPKS
jgi:hypothetical protein